MTDFPKSKYDNGQARKVERLRARGFTVSEVAAELGITRQTYYNWFNKGLRGVKPYTHFYTAVMRGDLAFLEGEAYYDDD